MEYRRKGEWLEVIVPCKWKGKTLGEVLRDIWHGSKKQIHQLRSDKAVLINGATAEWHSPLTGGERLQIKFFANQDFGVVPAYFDIDILYEDDHVLVANKPAGIDTHPNEDNETDTLANAVAFYLQAKGECCKVIHIHRLDKGTTGAVLFAKHSFVGAILDRLLEERKIKRTYLAMTDGIMKQKEGTITANIGRDRHHPTRRRVSPTGQTAVTHYKVLKTFPDTKRSLVQCVLDTGRTHQIRVHLSSIGHPISGDSLYGGNPCFPRPALHAAKLVFEHPFSDKIVCNAPFIDEIPIFPENALKYLS